jgi:Holliday junction resolvase RusA-like endonuclease
MTLAHAVIDGKAVPKGRPRVYHHDRYGRELARPRTVTPARTVVAEEMIRVAIQQQNPGLCPTEGLVSVDLTFYRPGAGDLDNLIKSVLDAANGVIWKDDRQVRRIEAVMWKGKRFGEPRTVLSVEPWEGE